MQSLIEEIDINDVIEQLAIQRNLSRTAIEEVLESSLREFFQKYYKIENIDVFFDSSKKRTDTFEVWIEKQVVDDSEYKAEDIRSIPLGEARKSNPDINIGDTFYDRFDLALLNRTDVFRLLKIIENKIIYKQYENVFSKYEQKIHKIVTGEVFRILPDKYILHDEDKIQLVLPKSEIIPTEAFRLGDIVKVVPIKVEIQKKMPLITVSRTSEYLLIGLLEQNVPEITDGIVKIVKVVREPGLRAKVVVDTTDDRIDPVMACVGPRGSRINPIVRELRNENIDVIRYSPVLKQMVINALSPAKVLDIEINEEDRKIRVIMKPQDVPLAIGKGGANIYLAQKLLNYTIEIYRETEKVDTPISQIDISIDAEVLSRLNKAGCETIRDLLMFDVNDLAEVSQLSPDIIKDLKRKAIQYLENK